MAGRRGKGPLWGQETLGLRDSGGNAPRGLPRGHSHKPGPLDIPALSHRTKELPEPAGICTRPPMPWRRSCGTPNRSV